MSDNKGSSRKVGKLKKIGIAVILFDIAASIAFLIWQGR